VRIDLPGADLENRLQLYEPWNKKPHVCEIISNNFPQSRHVYLRMRQICSGILQFKNCCQPLLENLVIDLDLEPNPRHQLDMDSCVVDCRCNERFGWNLLDVLLSDARRLTDCSDVPNIHTVRFLCKGSGSQYRPSGSASHGEAGSVWTTQTTQKTQKTQTTQTENSRLRVDYRVD
jgi:hypothetical protein